MQIVQFFRDVGLECIDCIDVVPDREYSLQCFPQVIAVVLQTEGSLLVESLSVDVDDDVFGRRFVEHLHVGVGCVYKIIQRGSLVKEAPVSIILWPWH